MKKLLSVGLIFLTLAGIAEAQGSLSNQVLRLLSRVNTWSALNTYTAGTGVILLGRQSVPLGTRTDRLENIGGNLYFNGVLLESSAASGTVTSVGLTVPSILSVSGSPVTSSGTLAVSLATQAANRVFAGPSTGADATPTFRALVAADIPDISSTYLTASSTATLTNKSGNISQWTNNSGYITNSVSSLTSLTAVGTIATGSWQATAIAGQYGGTGVNNSGKTITLGGNFTTSGANNVTLTTSGATNVTLPTNGTLISSTVTTLSSLTSIGTIGTGVWQGTAVTVPYGGSGASTLTGILQGNGTSAFTALTSSTVGQVLRVTGANTFGWGAVNLADTDAITGVLPAANGGLGVDTSGVTDGQLLIGKTSDNSLNLATLTGTANQVVVTNGGGTITLSTPQSIGTTSTPRFARLGLGTGAGSTAVITTTGIFDTGYYNAGNSSTAITIDWLNGMLQRTTLTDNATLTLNNPTANGTEFTLVLIQDGTGSHTVTWPATVKWAGNTTPTLTTTANRADICVLRWTGSIYFGSCSLNYPTS